MDKKSPEEGSCPAYASSTDCWYYDWESFWKEMADGPEKEEGKKGMLADCSSCPVREVHKEEVDLFMSKVRQV
ncbi:MAG: hypothetical protein H0Z29_05550 [Candidatus Marinimicrobia bacterium]|nr:hypothetical protein [Candidatus Neomarinimicrobiota bacterium]